MRILFALALTAMMAFAGAPKAEAQGYDYPWCAEYGWGNGGRNCGFTNLRQCRAALSGNGGVCVRNPMFQGRRGGGYVYR
jgi:hypothetical protein